MNQIDLAKAFKIAWDSGKTEFPLLSSGSTGAPKTIVLHRQWMEWSAEQTAAYMMPRASDHLFICLPLNRVGGLMMLVRAWSWRLPYSVQEATANPLLNEGVQGSIVSLTPYQLHHVMSDEISLNRLLKFREVLIGGAEIPLSLENRIRQIDNGYTLFRQSYGMTETYSHIAVRNLNGPEWSESFKTFDDIRIALSESGCLIIYAPFCPEGLITNDRVKLVGDKKFVVIGRADHVINSGGVKLQIEELEKTIREIYGIQTAFVISSKSDEILGERVVLVTENLNDFSDINWQLMKDHVPYGVPKELIEIKKLPANEGAKYDRLLIKKMIAQY